MKIKTVTVREDAEEIARRLADRNPEFFKMVVDKRISIADLAEIVIVQYKAFNNIK